MPYRAADDGFLGQKLGKDKVRAWLVGYSVEMSCLCIFSQKCA